MKPLLTAMAASAALALAACAAAPQTQYYSLPDSSYRLPPTAAQETVAVRVELAETLQSPALLYQTDAYTVHFAKQHLWASSLASALQNRFANELNERSSRWRFVPQQAAANNGRELVIHVERFQGRYDGTAQIDGYSMWQQNGNTTRFGNPFSVSTAQQGDGHAALVEALSRALPQAAAQILP